MPSQTGEVNLRSINLNLLPILNALLESKNVTAAARSLHMSQSAVSDALARLRQQFSDELLVRSGRNMVLTPFSETLRQPLKEILASVQNLVSDRTFMPKALNREFVIATADPVVMVIGGTLLRYLQTEAPNASARFVELHAGDEEKLQSMELDLVIVPRGFLRASKLVEQAMYKEEFVCIARNDHPAISGTITRQLYSKLPHVSFRSDQQSNFSMEGRLLGIAHADILKVPNFSLLPHIVEQTDAIAIVQKSVAERFAQLTNIQIYPPPVPIEPLDVCMYWSPTRSKDKAHEWFRNSLQSFVE